MDKTVYSFAKNTQEEVRAELTEYRGHRLINIRVWYKPPGEDEARPTKKGISLAVELFPELKKAIDKLGEALRGKEGEKKEEAKGGPG